MKMITRAVPFFCIALLACFGSWSPAAELPATPQYGLQSHGMPMQFPGEIGDMSGSAFIISGKEFNLTPSTSYYDENRNRILLKNFKKGDRIFYEYNESTSDLISLQKRAADEKRVVPTETKKDGGISTQQDRPKERKIQFSDGVYRN